MIILISASLPSNTYNKASWRENGTFKGTESLFSITLIFRWDCWFLLKLNRSLCFYLKSETRFQEQKQLDLIVPERTNHPISVLCPTRWFQILLNCEKQQFVFCTSNLLEQMYDFWKRTMFRQKRILNLQDLPQNRSLETVPVCIVLQYYPTQQYCLYSQVRWIFEINWFRRLSQVLTHFVMDRASLFTDHRISDCPILAKLRNFRIWEHTFDNSPPNFVSSSLKWWSTMHGVHTLKSCWVVLFVNSQYRSINFFSWPVMS